MDFESMLEYNKHKTEKKMIKKNICLKPEKINNEILENIYIAFSEEFKHTCDAEHGFIVAVYISQMNILSNCISSATTFGQVNLTVETRVKVLLPVVNGTYKAKVFKIISQGIIFTIIPEKIFVFVRNENLKGKNIKLGDVVDVTINSLKISSNTFNCTGTM